ncbi:hypothetical protein C8F04DRAFT_1276629 [Mycena alexandri]|uniref:Uncharacterized protein n=1 Tax=Mycena alexandri TaxID=1745969 RepID=A0AAD6WPQ7_9AGAR|nr:hypothetical protein C8F04DRAFT_1276629 [Mycena alexandri]
MVYRAESAVEGVMAKGEGNERPKGPITSHAKTNTTLRPSLTRRLPPLPPLQARSLPPWQPRSPPSSASLAAPPAPSPSAPFLPHVDVRQRRQWLPWSTRFCLPQPILELIPSDSAHLFTLPPLHNLLRYSARGDSPLLRAFKAAEAGNEHDESRIEQSTSRGDCSSRELALPARMGNVSPAGWVKTAYVGTIFWHHIAFHDPSFVPICIVSLPYPSSSPLSKRDDTDPTLTPPQTRVTSLP